MNWIIVILAIIAIYALIAGYLYRSKRWEEHITFYGPILGIKSDKTGFFDWFQKQSRFWRIYGTIGVLLVIIVSVGMAILLIFALHATVLLQPEPTGIYEPRNFIALPYINEFIPPTIAFWIALIITLIVHEFGHGILCRVEHIRVKSIGVLVAVLPVGAFVEPDEKEVEEASSHGKMRMYGAGIMNNVVIGLICFVLMAGLLGCAGPTAQPAILGLYEGYPAYNASVPSVSLIYAINDVSVSSREDVSTLLNTTRPGENIRLTVQHGGELSSHDLELSSWPQELQASDSGFMGVYYYDNQMLSQEIPKLLTPLGLLYMTALPAIAYYSEGMHPLQILISETPLTDFYTIPFPGFWFVINILFWCGWFNIVVGTFNALPMVPLDGGLIVKEGMERFLNRFGYARYNQYVIGFVSWLILVMLLSIILLPYLFSIF